MDQVPTIRQLAAMAGVSRTTVSLALRNHPSIPEITRDKIQRLATRNGYRSNPVVSSLMVQLRRSRMKPSTEKLAYLTCWNTATEWQSHSNDNNYYKGACRRANELGYELEHFWTREPSMTHSRLSKILHTRGIQGVIIAPLLRPHGHLSLDWRYHAAATISHTVYKPNIHRANHAHHSGMLAALRNLSHRGYRRIGFANLNDQNERVDNAWLAAYLLHHYKSPVSQRIAPLAVSSWKKQPFKEWLQKQSPDAVVSNSPEPFWLLQDLGYQIPEDIGYANLDVNEKMPFSGIDQFPQEIGALAVDLAVRQLQNNEFGLPKNPQSVQILGSWRDGDTTTAPKTELKIQALAEHSPIERISRLTA